MQLYIMDNLTSGEWNIINELLSKQKTWSSVASDKTHNKYTLLNGMTVEINIMFILLELEKL